MLRQTDRVRERKRGGRVRERESRGGRQRREGTAGTDTQRKNKTKKQSRIKISK